MNVKKIAMIAVQTTVTFFLLWWIFHNPEKRHQMTLALQSANLWFLVPGFICFGLVLVASTIRWSLLLSVQNIHLGWLRTWQLVMIGMFFNLFLLGSTGGDVVKIFYTMREVPKKKTAVFLSIVIDRLVGMFALMIITLVIGILCFSSLWATPVTRGILTTVTMVFGGFVIFLIMSCIINRYHLWKLIPEWLPGHAFLIDIATAFSSYSNSCGILSIAVLCSWIQNFFLFGSGIFAAYAFCALPGAPGAVPMIETIPLVNTISSIPISLSGIGVREGLFETLLNTLYGTPKSLAVLISLTYFFLTVLWGLLGGVVYLFYKPSNGESCSLDKMTSQVDLVETAITT